MSSWPFGALRPFSYGAIIADPPWPFDLYSDAGKAKSPAAHYDCMTFDEIAALPAGHLAAGDCILFMWTTWPHIVTGEATRIVRAWGFMPKTGGAWLKRTEHGKAAFGTGYLLRSACEPFIIATMGSPPLSGAQRSTRNIIEAKTRGHSRKPVDAHRMIEAIAPHAAKLELFARQRRKGWDAWGNEIEKFAPDADPE